SPDHDDDNGGDTGQLADRDRCRPRVGISPAARRRRRRWARGVAGPDPVHDPGHLPLYGAVQRMAWPYRTPTSAPFGSRAGLRARPGGNHPRPAVIHENAENKASPVSETKLARARKVAVIVSVPT